MLNKWTSETDAGTYDCQLIVFMIDAAMLNI